jgi:hypothetical protein
MATCTIIWNAEDVRAVAKDHYDVAINLTDEEIDRILQAMQDNHDATIGINWDTIEYWIDIILNEREPVQLKFENL